MGFSSSLQGKSSHEALLARQEAELKLLENLKRWLVLRITGPSLLILKITTDIKLTSIIRLSVIITSYIDSRYIYYKDRTAFNLFLK